MHKGLKGIVAGALALAGVALAGAEAQAMPVQPLSAPAAEAHVDQVYYYGYRRPFLRYRYGFRRPFVRRFGYYRPYGFRRFYGPRPYYRYGYGFRRF